MAPLAAYAGSWGTGSPSPNTDREGQCRGKMEIDLASHCSVPWSTPATGEPSIACRFQERE